jgi:hypothetical protein
MTKRHEQSLAAIRVFTTARPKKPVTLGGVVDHPSRHAAPFSRTTPDRDSNINLGGNRCQSKRENHRFVNFPHVLRNAKRRSRAMIAAMKN